MSHFGTDWFADALRALHLDRVWESASKTIKHHQRCDEIYQPLKYCRSLFPDESMMKSYPVKHFLLAFPDYCPSTQLQLETPGFRSLQIFVDMCRIEKKTDVLRNTMKTPQRCQTNNKNVQNWREVSYMSK